MTQIKNGETTYIVDEHGERVDAPPPAQLLSERSREVVRWYEEFLHSHWWAAEIRKYPSFVLGLLMPKLERNELVNRFEQWLSLPEVEGGPGRRRKVPERPTWDRCLSVPPPPPKLEGTPEYSVEEGLVTMYPGPLVNTPEYIGAASWVCVNAIQFREPTIDGYITIHGTGATKVGALEDMKQRGSIHLQCLRLKNIRIDPKWVTLFETDQYNGFWDPTWSRAVTTPETVMGAMDAAVREEIWDSMLRGQTLSGVQPEPETHVAVDLPGAPEVSIVGSKTGRIQSKVPNITAGPKSQPEWSEIKEAISKTLYDFIVGFAPPITFDATKGTWLGDRIRASKEIGLRGSALPAAHIIELFREWAMDPAAQEAYEKQCREWLDAEVAKAVKIEHLPHPTKRIGYVRVEPAKSIDFTKTVSAYGGVSVKNMATMMPFGTGWACICPVPVIETTPQGERALRIYGVGYTRGQAYEDMVRNGIAQNLRSVGFPWDERVYVALSDLSDGFWLDTWVAPGIEATKDQAALDKHDAALAHIDPGSEKFVAEKRKGRVLDVGEPAHDGLICANYQRTGEFWEATMRPGKTLKEKSNG